MDYEKKYNHALEVVRELQKDWASTQNRAAREIELAFPELRESEDERIRKTIVATIEQCPDDFLNPKNRDRMLEYLEKQKEQKPQIFCEAKAYDLGYKQGKEDAKKEQKPAEWGDEDENKIERLAFLVSVAEEKEMISPSESVDLRNFIKSLRPSWKPSEELLEALHIAAYIREIEFYGGIKDKLRQLYENLKRL